jgi:hypothetical protein
MITVEENKAIVLKAFDTLFNKRDYEKAAAYWSDTYIQHSAHIAPGRDGLFDLVRALPDTLRYESALILAEEATVFKSTPAEFGAFMAGYILRRGAR